MKDLKYKIKNICCVGAGYVGGPSMTVIAEKCPEITVKVVDINSEKINNWNDKDFEKIPVYEPGLVDVLKRVRNKNLFFSTDIEGAIKNADMVFISVNTPIKNKGIGAGQASNLHWVESCARQISSLAEGFTIVVEKSTLPVRTAETIKKILFPSKKDVSNKTFAVLSNPEFLSEGNAIDDLLNPDRVLIGGEDIDAIFSLKSIYSSWVDESKIICTNLWSSELSKLVANAFLAQRISAINSVTAICEASGAEVTEVVNAIGTDKRIGNKFLNPGPGFGGSCFKKDILNLVYLCNHFGLNEVAEFWEQVIKINSWQQERIYKIVVSKLFGNIVNKKLAILGFSFKSNTNDTRESPSINLCKNFLLEGAFLAIHDPKVDRNQIEKDLNNPELKKDNSFSREGNWVFEETVYDAIKDSDGVIILTEWDYYRNLDWHKISCIMRAPSWIFDTRLILDPIEIKETGLNLWRLGDGENKKIKPI